MNLRRAQPGDSATLLAWRNDPGTRMMSFDQGEVSPEDHEAWLAAKLADPASEIWIGSVDGRPIGQVRFDLVEDGVAVVSIAVAPEARGRNYGRAILCRGLDAQRIGARLVRAYVLPGNAASLRVFRRCGFAETERTATRVTLERPTSTPA